MKLVALISLFSVSVACAGDTDSNWIHETAEDDTSYADVFVLRQDSSATIKDEYAKNDVRPQLEFRCAAGDPTILARIHWQRFISSFSTEAGFKIDGGKFTWLKWKVDSSEQVTLSPSGADSQRLIELLSGGSELVVDISPYSEGPVQAVFDVTTFADELSKLAANCQ